MESRQTDVYRYVNIRVYLALLVSVFIANMMNALLTAGDQLNQ